MIGKRTMWFLFTVLTATVSGQYLDGSYTTHLDDVMTGFDPFCMNSFIQPDPGRRSMIFQPIRTPIHSLDDEFIVNKFIKEAEVSKCVPGLTIQTVTNYKELHEYAASLTYHISSAVNYASPEVRYGNFASCETKSNSRDHAMRQFFEDTGGEVLLVSAECVTRTITIDPFEPLLFEPAFERALARLYEAALNPASETSENTFSDFVWSYGTHFSKRSQLGSRVILGKLFSSRAATVGEETIRRRCVLEAAGEALTPCMRRCNETTLTHFARASSERCGETEHEVLAIITGPLPVRNIDSWSSVAEELPEPIYYRLEPITTLFARQWSTSDDAENKLNKTILHNFFVKKLADYSSSILSGGLARDMTNVSVSKYGPVLMMGGYKDDASGFVHLSSGEAVDTWTLPDLPHATCCGTLAAVGSNKIFSCGGWSDDTGRTSACYTLDRASASPRWDSTASLPLSMSHHTSVTVRNHIWTVFESKLYDLNTETNKFNTFHLPLNVSNSHCAVSNGSHSFVIRAGASYNEIWVNTEEYNPAKWHRVGHLRAGIQYSGCVWLEQEVFITGGFRDPAGAEVFDTVTHALRSAGTLVHGRYEHRMMVLEGKPAVVGGNIGGAATRSIETYDQRTGLWTTSPRSLAEDRVAFGLVQLHGNR